MQMNLKPSPISNWIFFSFYKEILIPEKHESSLKFRENQDPVLKSKIPLKILGFPFRSSLEASTNSKELCLSFCNAFKCGPSYKVNYRPNDPSSPFGFVRTTGVGRLGSPIEAPLSISAEFNLLGTNKIPRFFLHLNPRMGDIASKQTIVSDKSQCPLSVSLPHDSDIECEAFLATASDEEQENVSLTGMLYAGFEAAISLVRSGEIHARTAVPVRDVAVVNLRWGVRFPATSEHGDWSKNLPHLVLNKIGLEHVEGRNETERRCDSREIDWGNDVVEECLGVKKELAVSRNENEALKKEFDMLVSEIRLE